MTIRDAPVSEFLVILVPAIVLVMILTSKDSTDAFLWIVGALVLCTELTIARLYTTFGPVVGTDMHDPARTLFIAIVISVAAPFLARIHRTHIGQQKTSEDAE